jgi:single-strand DNA-binding protein
MTDFNQAIILGNLTKDPELRYTPNGQAVTSFSVATNRRWTNQSGEQQEQTEFHNVVAWGKLAEICTQILYKGRKVLIAGRLQTRSWEGQDGVKRYSTEIVADQISATGAPKTSQDGDIQKNVSTEKPIIKNDTKPTETAKPADKTSDTEEINLDDIPF